MILSFIKKPKIIGFGFFLAMAVLLQLPAFAYQKEDMLATGKVLTKDGAPLEGVTVSEKESGNKSTISSKDGSFSLMVDAKSTIIFSSVGYKTVEMPATKVKNLTITLIKDELNLDEVVVTGYVTQRKADLTGAVSVVNVNQLQTSPAGGAMKALQGKVAGMSISANGSPNPSATIRIRGEGTLNNNNPLFIIDGTPTTRSMGELALMDIESIQVLKDASSASIYGSRAANGVIIITTRKGKKGTVINFNASYTTVSSKKPYNLMNTEQRGIAQYWAIKNDNPDADPSVVGIGGLYNYEDHKDADGNFVLDKVSWREYLDPVEKTMKSANTDWEREILRRGQVQQYNVSLATGNNNGHALLDLDYYNNQGTIKGSFFNRFTGRINSDYSWLDGHVKVGENFTVSKWQQSSNIGDGNLGSTKSLMSIVPVHTADGVGWGGPIGGMSDRQNPVRLIEDNLQNHSDQMRLFGNGYINIEFIKGLTFHSSFGLDFAGYWAKQMDLTYQSGFLSEDRNKVYEEANYGLNWNNSNVLQYNFDKGMHNFDIVLGQETISQATNILWGSRRVYALETPNYMQLDPGETERDNGGNEGKNTMLSWFGKVNYNYNDRYLASVTLRKDASSVFGSNNPWATFPAFSLGWVLTNEKFIGLPKVLSHLKLRYGWGQNGNSQIDNYAAYQMYEFLYDANSVWDWNWGTAYDFTGQGGNLPSGFRRTQRGNPDLRWETTTQSNYGVDFGFFNSQLNGSFDYYIKSTKDILMKPGTVATLGEGAGKWLNGADIRNKGFELTLNFTHRKGDLGFNIGGVFSHNKQTIVKVPEDVINNFAGNGEEDNILGRSRNSMYGYIAEGLFQTQTEVEKSPSQVGAAPGRIKYKDISGPDGKPDQKIDNYDRTWIGVQDPDFEYGLSFGITYKNFDFNVFLNGVLGKDLNVSGWKTWTDIYALSTSGENYGTRMLDAWTPTNTKSTIPALSINNYNDEGRFSTYYVESGSYLKIRNAELGYTIPKNVINTSKINNIRAYVRCDNIITIKKTRGKNAYTGLDPETPGNSYPLPFSLTAGFKLTF